MPRSLRLRLKCIPAVKSSLLRNGFPSQKILAEDLGIAQSTVSHFLNGKPVDYANFIEICRGLAQEWRDIADFEDGSDSVETQSISAKIAILFVGVAPVGAGFANARSNPNHTLIQQLHQALTAASHEVFLVNNISKDNSYLKVCDYLILLISDESAASEMILEQVQLAKELHNLTAHKPAILPICVELNAPVSFDLFNHLAGI
jgi:DNA-binding Xre family transcriptional regulator